MRRRTEKKLGEKGRGAQEPRRNVSRCGERTAEKGNKEKGKKGKDSQPQVNRQFDFFREFREPLPEKKTQKKKKKTFSPLLPRPLPRTKKEKGKKGRGGGRGADRCNVDAAELSAPVGRGGGKGKREEKMKKKKEDTLPERATVGGEKKRKGRVYPAHFNARIRPLRKRLWRRRGNPRGQSGNPAFRRKRKRKKGGKKKRCLRLTSDLSVRRTQPKGKDEEKKKEPRQPDHLCRVRRTKEKKERGEGGGPFLKTSGRSRGGRGEGRNFFSSRGDGGGEGEALAFSRPLVGTAYNAKGKQKKGRGKNGRTRTIFPTISRTLSG